jgi:hypothetical protein
VQGQDLRPEQRLRQSGRIVGMGCSVKLLLVRRLLDLLRLGPSPDQKDVEIAVLRLKSASIRFEPEGCKLTSQPRSSRVARLPRSL